MARLLKILILFGAALSPAAFGGAISYTDRGSWLSNSSGVTNIDFQSQSLPGTFAGYSTASGLTVSGVSFVGVEPPGYSLAVAPSEGYFWSGHLAYLWGPEVNHSGPSTQFIDVTLPGNITSVGMDLFSIYPGTMTVLLSSGDQTSLSLGGLGYSGFLGFTTTAPISSLRVYYNYTETFVSTGNLDNFAFGTASAPEPSSFALFLASSVVVLSFRRILASRRP